MITGLTQLDTHDANQPLAWAVVRYEPGEYPRAAGIHEEIPAELVAWAKELNAKHPAVPHGFGIVSRDSITNTICVIDAKNFSPADGRGRYLAAIGLSAGSTRPAGLSPAAAWKHCPALAALLDEFYGTDSRPAPPAPPAPPRELTTAEKLDAARQSLYGALADGMRSNLFAPGALAAIERFVDAKLAAQST